MFLVWSAIAAIVLVVVLFIILAARQPKLDADLCPENLIKNSGHAIVLVDQTDAFSPEQARDLKDLILDLRNRLPRYRRLSVMLIGSTVETPPLMAFSLCNPGRAGQINGLIESDRSLPLFDAPLDRLLTSLEIQSTQPKSPILETIAEVSRLPDFQAGPRELTIVSDLLENSALLTQYHHPISFNKLAAMPDYAAAKANLNDISVRLFYLKRPGTETVQDQSQRAFWLAYFRSSHAHDVAWCGVRSATDTKREVRCVPALN